MISSLSDSHCMISLLSDSHHVISLRSDSHRVISSLSDSHHVISSLSDSHHVISSRSDSHRGISSRSDSHRVISSLSMLLSICVFVVVYCLVINLLWLDIMYHVVKGSFTLQAYLGQPARTASITYFISRIIRQDCHSVSTTQ